MHDKEQVGWESRNPRAEATGATIGWDIPWQPLASMFSYSQALVCTSAKGEGRLEAL